MRSIRDQNLNQRDSVMGYFEKILQTFAYNGWPDLVSSLMPSTKYEWLTPFSLSFSSLIVLIQVIFGFDALAFIALLVVMLAEISSGIIASRYRKEPFSSMKLSRFTFKVTYYLILIFVTNSMASSFKGPGQGLASTIFHWMHIFLTVQIVLENIVSILENVSVISGKDKTHWISKIQSKIENFLS